MVEQFSKNFSPTTYIKFPVLMRYLYWRGEMCDVMEVFSYEDCIDNQNNLNKIKKEKISLIKMKVT